MDHFIWNKLRSVNLGNPQSMLRHLNHPRKVFEINSKLLSWHFKHSMPMCKNSNVSRVKMCTIWPRQKLPYLYLLLRQSYFALPSMWMEGHMRWQIKWYSRNLPLGGFFLAFSHLHPNLMDNSITGSNRSYFWGSMRASLDLPDNLSWSHIAFPTLQHGNGVQSVEGPSGPQMTSFTMCHVLNQKNMVILLVFIYQFHEIYFGIIQMEIFKIIWSLSPRWDTFPPMDSKSSPIEL